MADRFTQQFIACNNYIRERLDSIGAQQTRQAAIFHTFSLEFVNLILPHPILPIDHPRHGTPLGRAFLLYHQLQREEHRIRELRFRFAEYLVEYSEIVDTHLAQTLQAVQLTDHQVDSLVEQYRTLEESSRSVANAIRENGEARRQLWFFYRP